MKINDFNEAIQNQISFCTTLLDVKGNEYVKTEDRLSAFKRAADFQNITPKQALFGMLTKHLICISEMIKADTKESLDCWQEKLADSLNYLLILWAIVNEENDNEKY